MQADESRSTVPVVVVLIGLVLSPLGAVSALAYWITANRLQLQHRWDWAPLAAFGVIGILGYKFYAWGWFPYLAYTYLSHGRPLEWSLWFAPHAVSFGTVGVLVTAMRGFRYLTDPEAISLAKSRRKEARRVRKQTGKRPVSAYHSLVFGVSGSGKTAGMMSDVKAAVEAGFTVIIDGKGGVESFSLYDGARRLAKENGRPFVVIDARRSLRKTRGAKAYNPFSSLKTPDQVKDAITAMIDSGSVGNDGGYYLSMYEAYSLQAAKLLLAAKVPVDFANVVAMFDGETFKDLAAKVGGDTQTEAMRVFDNTADDIKASGERLATAFHGAGKEIFGSKKAFSLAAAEKKKAVVVVLLDTFSQPYLSKAIAALVINDIKTLIAKRLDAKASDPAAIFMDEFSVYGSASVLDIMNKARSAGFRLEIATQSLADIDGMENGKELRRSLVDNAAEFYVYRLNDPDSAEGLAKVIGTYESVTQTTRSNSAGLTEDGSNSIANAFKVSPDDLKELDDNKGVYYSKKTKKVVRFKNKFVEFDD